MAVYGGLSMSNRKPKEEAVSDEEIIQWSPRKSDEFIRLSDITPEERIISDSYITDPKFASIEKIKFTCQPKSKDPDHSSLDTITKTTPLKEVIYRLLMNNRKQMKLGDIIEKVYEVQKTRNLRFNTYKDNVPEIFYKVMKEDAHYGFEEIE
jgi:hypothetical protein